MLSPSLFLAGYRFAGLRSGWFCYCGNYLDRFDEAPDDECDWGCPLNSQLSCGGDFQHSVYNTSN